MVTVIGGTRGEFFKTPGTLTITSPPPVFYATVKVDIGPVAMVDIPMAANKGGHLVFRGYPTAGGAGDPTAVVTPCVIPVMGYLPVVLDNSAT